MKQSRTCPKCGSSDIYRFDGWMGPYGSGNYIRTGKLVNGSVNVNRYVCGRCGYVEEWIDREDLPKLLQSSKARKV